MTLRRAIVLAAAIVIAGCGAQEGGAALAADGAWSVDRTASTLEFTATQAGRAFTGSFADFDASIVFDPDNLDAANIKVTVATASAKTGDRQRDAALPTADWFSVKAHPAAIFAADKVERTGDGAYLATGTLQIRGVEKDLSLPFTLSINGDRAVAEGGASLIRTDFGVGQGEFQTDKWVGLDVEVRFHLEANR